MYPPSILRISSRCNVVIFVLSYSIPMIPLSPAGTYNRYNINYRIYLERSTRSDRAERSVLNVRPPHVQRLAARVVRLLFHVRPELGVAHEWVHLFVVGSRRLWKVQFNVDICYSYVNYNCVGPCFGLNVCHGYKRCTLRSLGITHSGMIHLFHL